MKVPTGSSGFECGAGDCVVAVTSYPFQGGRYDEGVTAFAASIAFTTPASPGRLSTFIHLVNLFKY